MTPLQIETRCLHVCSYAKYLYYNISMNSCGVCVKMVLNL